MRILFFCLQMVFRLRYIMITALYVRHLHINEVIIDLLVARLYVRVPWDWGMCCKGLHVRVGMGRRGMISLEK